MLPPWQKEKRQRCRLIYHQVIFSAPQRADAIFQLSRTFILPWCGMCHQQLQSAVLGTHAHYRRCCHDAPSQSLLNATKSMLSTSFCLAHSFCFDFCCRNYFLASWVYHGYPLATGASHYVKVLRHSLPGTVSLDSNWTRFVQRTDRSSTESYSLSGSLCLRFGGNESSDALFGFPVALIAEAMAQSLVSSSPPALINRHAM